MGVVVGGFWLDRKGPRRVAMTGIALWGVGNVLAGFGTTRFGAPWLYLTYGLIGGIGAGMAYLTPLAVVSKWFPERRGLVGGLVVGSFGLGAFVYNQLIPRLPAFHAFSAHAAEVLRNPPAGYASRTSSKCSGACYGYSPASVVRMPQFYLLWLQLFANVIAGATIISNAVVILADLTALAPAQIGPWFGVVSVFNAVGRFFWGGISDRIGCQLELRPGADGLGGGRLLGPVLVARAKDFGITFAALMPAIACALMASVICPFSRAGRRKPCAAHPAALRKVLRGGAGATLVRNPPGARTREPRTAGMP